MHAYRLDYGYNNVSYGRWAGNNWRALKAAAVKILRGSVYRGGHGWYTIVEIATGETIISATYSPNKFGAWQVNRK